MKTIPPLILKSLNQPQSVHLRCQLHYGEHDMLLNAQPFNDNLPFHSLICYPGAGNDTYIFWALPSEDDFEPIDGQRLSGAPLGHLSPTMIQELHAEFLKLFSSSASPRFVNDPDIQTLRPRVHHLLSQLTIPSLFEQAVMRWRIAQQMILFIKAQITWLVDVKPTFAEPDAWKVHSLHNVVGAVTEDSLVVERLYRAGIPAFGHSDSRLRQDTLNTFFRIMRGWSRSSSPMHSDTVRQGERLCSTRLRGIGELKDAEYYLAEHYIYTFADFFRRAPILPHFL
ncbi:hypothetical protein BDP27DRAFT_1430714 [Rhodocollybia butyracea]|uniref:Uncharacterized protein n=1 Tax=Rhodocollybia butyracea TaxID=206335 RepID=A0A9P5PD55_9AGAR|nr:hypothetical protein BDP27DRAFT_1430714 [Rhodocollybia butyracea]